MVFIPTYLYIKRHSVTGKLYFGKTYNKRGPEKYCGSGKVWIRHITKHGKMHVETLWFCLFHTEESIKEFALNFSKEQNIVESTQWLNLKDENGIDGGFAKDLWSNRQHLAITKHKISVSKSKPLSDEHKLNISLGSKGKAKGPFTEEHKLAMRKPKSSTINMRGPKATLECPHCKKIGIVSNMKRWHFDNCKLKS